MTSEQKVISIRPIPAEDSDSDDTEPEPSHPSAPSTQSEAPYGASMVVRYGGGPQAQHNVVREDGTWHCFSQLGSGALNPGVCTFLSRFMIIDPRALFNELDAFAAKGFNDAVSRLFMDRECFVLTPLHKLIGQMREIGRCNRHGTTGRGVGILAREIAYRRKWDHYQEMAAKREKSPGATECERAAADADGAVIDTAASSWTIQRRRRSFSAPPNTLIQLSDILAPNARMWLRDGATEGAAGTESLCVAEQQLMQKLSRLCAEKQLQARSILEAYMKRPKRVSSASAPQAADHTEWFDPDVFTTLLKTFKDATSTTFTPSYLRQWCSYIPLIFQRLAGANDEKTLSAAMRAHIVDGRELLRAELKAAHTVVFEGSQAALLDYRNGFFPHVTKTRCNIDGAMCLLHESAVPFMLTRVGIMRTYGARHGQGPFVSELPRISVTPSAPASEVTTPTTVATTTSTRASVPASSLTPAEPLNLSLPESASRLTSRRAHLCEAHNSGNQWQGDFRVGYCDFVALRYALSTLLPQRVDALAVTYCDRLETFCSADQLESKATASCNSTNQLQKVWPVCISYRFAGPDSPYARACLEFMAESVAAATAPTATPPPSGGDCHSELSHLEVVRIRTPAERARALAKLKASNSARCRRTTKTLLCELMRECRPFELVDAVPMDTEINRNSPVPPLTVPRPLAPPLSSAAGPSVPSTHCAELNDAAVNSHPVSEASIVSSSSVSSSPSKTAFATTTGAHQQQCHPSVQQFCALVERQLSIPVRVLSFGPRRNQKTFRGCAATGGDLPCVVVSHSSGEQ